MLEDLKWQRGSGEANVIGAFAELARKASTEAGAEVLIVIKFPEYNSSLIASNPIHPARRGRLFSADALANGLDILHRWLRSNGEDSKIQEAFEKFKSRDA